MPHSAVRHSTSHANSAPRRRGGPHLQACSGSEAAFDEANSSSRASPRYVSMTFTSAAQIGTGCPRLSPTRGSPSGDALRGGAARPAAPRAGRSRPSGGGPRQLGSSMPGPRTVSVAASAGRIRCASRQPVRTIASASWLGVAAEDGVALGELKPFTRQLMRQMEQDLDTALDWLAVDHFDTGQPHTHVVARGVTDEEKILYIAGDYIAHGVRARASDLVTLQLGARPSWRCSRSSAARSTTTGSHVSTARSWPKPRTAGWTCASAQGRAISSAPTATCSSPGSRDWRPWSWPSRFEPGVSGAVAQDRVQPQAAGPPPRHRQPHAEGAGRRSRRAVGVAFHDPQGDAPFPCDRPPQGQGPPRRRPRRQGLPRHRWRLRSRALR